MIAISFRDVQFAMEHLGYPKLSEVALLSPNMDEITFPILQQLGMDITLPVSVAAYNHRDMNDKTGVGFRFEGRMRLDKEWTTGRGCSVMERIAATAYTDTSLTRELCSLVGTSMQWGDEAGYMQNSDFEVGDIMEDYADVTLQIQNLNKLAESIRGEQFA